VTSETLARIRRRGSLSTQEATVRGVLDFLEKEDS
jgi:hypothetical protein